MSAGLRKSPCPIAMPVWTRLADERRRPPGASDGPPDIVVAWAATVPFARRIYLFGSRAQCDHRPDSDIDLAVRNGIDPVELAMSVRSALRSEMPIGAQLEAPALCWTFEASRDRWHAAVTAPFDVPVQLERSQRADLLVRPSSKRCRVLLYRRAEPRDFTLDAAADAQASRFGPLAL